MTRALVLLLALVGAATQTTAPPIQNGRVETRQTTTIERELATLGTSASEPVWAGWRVPIVEGQRGGCCTYSDDGTNSSGVRGCFVDTTAAGGGRVPQITPSAGPVPLEAGTGLMVLVRLVDGHVERLRTLGDDCPLDAGGRTVYWLQGVTAVDSVNYLDSVARRDGPLPPAQEQRLSESAVSAIALHQDSAADTILDRLATSNTDSTLRRLARSLLGSTRGARGFGVLRQLIDAERLPDIRRQLVNAIGQTRQPGTADILFTLARSDSDPKVRAEAIYWWSQRARPQAVAEIVAVIDNDASDTVKQRAVQGLARGPAVDRTPLLIQLARTNRSLIVRKEAVTALGRSSDPRATAFLEELLK